MTVGTPRLHQQNVELFARLNQELKSIQGQVGSGKVDLKLSGNLHDISKLNAAEEKKSEVTQFMQNAKRASKDIEFLDVALDRLQNLTVTFQTMAVESANDMLGQKEKDLLILEAQVLKKEIFDLANQNDSSGNSLFGGMSGNKNPFIMNTDGSVSYEGSALRREVKVSPSLSVQQNFSGLEIFNNISDGEGKTSIFKLIDDFVLSLEKGANKGHSSNLFSDSGTVDLVFPSSGSETDFEFVLTTRDSTSKINTTIYDNDFSPLVSEINDLTSSTGISASIVDGNRVRLQGSAVELNLSNFSTSNFDPEKSFVSVIKDVSSSVVAEKITESRIESDLIIEKIQDAFEQFSTARAQVA
ncbi:MAG: hypothetical protein CMO49_06630, partial [Verrucomicrobiales bacterium]|nr:hypothetical protein [Verrucomicrobiales bacterium]